MYFYENAILVQFIFLFVAKLTMDPVLELETVNLLVV